MVYPDELKEFDEKLTGFRSVLTFTGNYEKGMESGRLHYAKLQSFLHTCNRQAAIYVCGPEQMMRQVRRDLKRLGFNSSAIYTEAFGF
jgi:ferredoxin-NADP reductase